MDFYTELSRYYDEIFTVSQSEMDFLKQRFSTCTSILDIGCGTGNKTTCFSEQGRTVIGIDLDEGMITRAKQEHAASGISYEVLDMRDVATRFGTYKFDGVLCLGNTLVHLNGVEGVSSFIHQVADTLVSKGYLAVQILNYDHLTGPDDLELPVLDAEHVRFLRKYQWRQGQMHFVTAIEVKAEGVVFENDIVLTPLKKAELQKALNAAGMKNVEWFGGYDGQALTSESFVSIAVSQKA